MSGREEKHKDEMRVAIEVARDNKDLGEMACLDPESREIIGCLNAFRQLTGSDALEVFRKPLIMMGRGRWPHNEKVDLGLMYGSDQ